MAAALSFDPNKNAAPQVIAKGMGIVAENIMKKAEESEVPVYVDEKLVMQLQNLEIGDTIPEEMFEVVAEVLIFVSQLDQKRGRQAGKREAGK